MTTKDYKFLAHYMGGVLGRAQVRGGDKARTLAYDESYPPLVRMLANDNPRFDQVKFSFATAQAEAGYHDGTSRVVRNEIVTMYAADDDRRTSIEED